MRKEEDGDEGQNGGSCLREHRRSLRSAAVPQAEHEADRKERTEGDDMQHLVRRSAAARAHVC